MLEILKFSVSGFWIFIGCYSIISLFLYFVINGILRLVSRTYRFFIIMKYGYPPEHCDADGDLKVKS